MRSEKLAGDIQSPWIEVRDDVQISIKLLPKEPVDIRIAVAKAIKDTLGPKAEIFDYYPGGYASLDLNPRGVNKAVALKDLILEFVLQNHVVLYFGDEFYRKVDAQGKLQKLGNDISVLDVDGIIPVAVNESITPPVQTEAQRIKWIGSGPTATHEFILELRKRVERFLKPDNEQLAAIIKEDEVFQNAL